jgi:hypothetical protein
MEPVRITDIQREQAADVLHRACGEGRLTLEEFSARVGAAWAADTSTELETATAGLAAPLTVGSSGQVEEKITNVFGECKRRGRWRLRGGLRLTNVFGASEIDLREVAVGPEVMDAHTITISGRNVFGEVKVIVPEGVDVEMSGSCVFGARDLKLAPVPRLPGTPLVRVHINTLFGETTVRSSGPASESSLARWARGTFGA